MRKPHFSILQLRRSRVLSDLYAAHERPSLNSMVVMAIFDSATVSNINLTEIDIVAVGGRVVMKL